MAGLKRSYDAAYQWIERRLGLIEPLTKAAEHPTPASNASWWYVFGSAATVLFLLQVVTGILLALIYSPSANEAWNTLNQMNQVIPLGWFVRAVHGWGSDFMVAIVLIHMVQVFLFGSYKYPRELTWIVGVLLLLLTLGMAFTGQVMRFDQDAYWGLGIGASIVSRVPYLGAPLVHLLLGGPIIGGATLTRFFALHVFVVPGILFLAAGVHIWMTLFHGVSEWPMPGRLVSKATYEREYHELTKKTGIPFVPDAAWKDAVFAAVIILAVMACAFFLGPIGPGGVPDPTIIQTYPKPDIPFLWIYSVLAFLPPSIETPFMLIVPVLVILAMLALPLFAGQGERHWSRRPVAVLMICLIAVSLGVLTHLGTYTPWSPVMDAWTSAPISDKYMHNRSPLERQGALVLENKQCRDCHQVGSYGGLRGPALDGVASRMTEDQIIRQILQGGGNMPAYGNALSPAETKALMQFLMTLKGDNQPYAVDESRILTHADPTHPNQQQPPPPAEPHQPGKVAP